MARSPGPDALINLTYIIKALPPYKNGIDDHPANYWNLFKTLEHMIFTNQVPVYMPENQNFCGFPSCYEIQKQKEPLNIHVRIGDLNEARLSLREATRDENGSLSEDKLSTYYGQLSCAVKWLFAEDVVEKEGNFVLANNWKKPQGPSASIPHFG